MKLNHSLKFSTSKGPTLDDFTLGYIHAACESLETYREFSQRDATPDDLSHMSVIMMRDDAERIFKALEPQLNKADAYINMNQLGYDLWSTVNDKPVYYLSILPKNARETLMASYKEHGNPSEMKKEDGNFILEFKDSKTQEEKLKFYCENYKSLTISEPGDKLVGKPVEEGVPIVTTINRSSQELRDLVDKLMSLPDKVPSATDKPKP